MRPRGPTFWLLDGRTGWRTADADGVVVDAREGLRLAADPAGTRSPASPDGSLGGLVLPPVVAVDGAGQVFLLAGSPRVLRRLDRATRTFVPWPLDEADPADAVAAAGWELAVTDRRTRGVTVRDTRTGALHAVWEPRDGAGRRVPADHHDAWDPASVARGPLGWHVLDAAHGTVVRFHDPLGRPEIVAVPGGPWRRLAVDRQGRLYLLGGGDRLHVHSPDGDPLETVADAGEVADRFDPPPLTADHQGRICVPAALIDPCGPGRPDAWFDTATGEPTAVAPDGWAGPPTHRTAGTWIAGPLDSALHRCQWHRIELDLGALPPGSRVGISTYTDGRERTLGDVLAVPDTLWARLPDLVGPAAGEPDRPAAPPRGDAAVLSREGRYLWLRLRLRGDGRTTPTVRAVRVHYPRRTHLELLPAVYSADDAARRFLERFLAAVQTHLEPVEHRIRDVAALFDPAAAPPAMIDFLSSWLALAQEGDWDVGRRRRLLAAVPPVLTARGTPRALRRHLRAYLENLLGADLPDDGFPHLVEGHRERHHLLLTGQDPVGGRIALWSAGVRARLQLDRHATEGKVRLLSTGDPDRDVFHHYAHRFRVVVPAPWVRTAADERMLRRAIEAEKPAHAAYELALITPGIRVGRQATVGIDTVVGALPRARLGCRHDTGAAPSAPPRGRLGVDTVLGAGSGPGPREVRLPARTGTETALR